MSPELLGMSFAKWQKPNNPVIPATPSVITTKIETRQSGKRT